jgi:hypothetical protein
MILKGNLTKRTQLIGTLCVCLVNCKILYTYVTREKFPFFFFRFLKNRTHYLVFKLMLHMSFYASIIYITEFLT